jgi:hypothetical protein
VEWLQRIFFPSEKLPLVYAQEENGPCPTLLILTLRLLLVELIAKSPFIYFSPERPGAIAMIYKICLSKTYANFSLYYAKTDNLQYWFSRKLVFFKAENRQKTPAIVIAQFTSNKCFQQS